MNKSLGWRRPEAAKMSDQEALNLGRKKCTAVTVG